MENDKILKTPKIVDHSILIDDEIELNLHSTEFENAIQISIYTDIPKIGSYSLAYPIGDLIERVIIFSGKNHEFSTALAQIVAKNKKKLTYASVFIDKDVKVSLENIKNLLELYF